MLFSEIIKSFPMFFFLILGDRGSEKCCLVLSREIRNSLFRF